MERKNVLAIIGSASEKSANEKLIEYISVQTQDDFNINIFDRLKELPHFDPLQSADYPPDEVISFRNLIHQADAVIICTPEYVFSIPSGLKNAIEWCVATTVFSGKSMGLITASANGEKCHEELQLIMRTLMAKFTEETTLLINGIKGKIDNSGKIIDARTITQLKDFLVAFKILVLN